MGGDAQFVTYLLEQLAPLGPVRAQRMFGGHGLYLDDAMLAIVVDDIVYLKTDDGNRTAFEGLGMMPFEYVRRGKSVRLGFHRLPDTALDEREELLRLARLALEAALRARAGRRKQAPRGH
jgi:DNA transformation protein